MALSQRQKDATAGAMVGCARVGLYANLSLTPTQFRAKKCSDLVIGCRKKCPIGPQNYNTCLITFRETMRAKLKKKGYRRPLLYLQLLCAKKQEDNQLKKWTWGDWCDHAANRLR